MFNFKNKRELIKLILILVLLIIVICSLRFIFKRNSRIKHFSEQMVNTFDENKNSSFYISQILVYSSANGEDESDDSSLKDISISQYSDIAIYISNDNNSQELSEENTINELYIDNIKIETEQTNPNFIFGYKNPKFFGKYSDIVNSLNTENLASTDTTKNIDTSDENAKIEFNVIHSNSDNTEDYTKPNFFTDCSNPITLGFINSEIVKHFKFTAENKVLALNGEILKSANVDLSKITPKISFEIHIVNNLNEEYSRKVYLDIDLENSEGSIENGYIIIWNRYSKSDLGFIKVEK
jgi:hypothetical protein